MENQLFQYTPTSEGCTENGHKVTFRNDIMSVLGLDSGYTAKNALLYIYIYQHQHHQHHRRQHHHLMMVLREVGAKGAGAGKYKFYRDQYKIYREHYILR